LVLRTALFSCSYVMTVSEGQNERAFLLLRKLLNRKMNIETYPENIECIIYMPRLARKK